MSILRAEIIAKIRKGIREGIGATRLYRELRAVGPVTRKTDFLSDYRNMAGVEKKKGLLKYVRKDRYPTHKITASVTWEMSKEFMYVVKSESILRPEEPPVITHINIMSDVPMTPEMIEQEAWERSFKQSPLKSGEERRFIAESAIHRAEI